MKLCWVSKRVRMNGENGLQLECPLGNDLKPSFKRELSVWVQIPEVTSTQAGSKMSPTMGLMANSLMRSRSGLHLESRSGLGFPNRFFMPWVIKKAVARERAKPIHPVFHSQSFLLQISAFGVPRSAVGPGTKTRDTNMTMAAGMTRETTTRSHVGIFSLV